MVISSIIIMVCVKQTGKALRDNEYREVQESKKYDVLRENELNDKHSVTTTYH